MSTNQFIDVWNNPLEGSRTAMIQFVTTGPKGLQYLTLK